MLFSLTTRAHLNVILPEALQLVVVRIILFIIFLAEVLATVRHELSVGCRIFRHLRLVSRNDIDELCCMILHMLIFFQIILIEGELEVLFLNAEVEEDLVLEQDQLVISLFFISFEAGLGELHAHLCLEVEDFQCLFSGEVATRHNHMSAICILPLLL